MNTCSNCKYWIKQKYLLNELGSSAARDKGGEDCGQCRGTVPHHALGKGGMFRVFPITIASDWCGAWIQSTVKESLTTETASISAPAVVVDTIEPKRRGRPPKDSV